MAVRCDVCKGQKVVLGLGGIRKECVGCNGVGYVSDAVPGVVAVADALPKRRGRKKKGE